MAEFQAIEMSASTEFLGRLRHALALHGSLPDAVLKAQSFDDLRRELTVSEEILADSLAACLALPRISYDDLRKYRAEVGLFSTRFLREARLYPFASSMARPPSLSVSRLLPRSSVLLN